MRTDEQVLQRLRSALADSGKTQAEVGRAAGMTQSQLSRYLTGRRPLAMAGFIAICDALGLSPAQVFADLQKEREA
jgi:transcriptional regulator with XRE-family HTH domain